MTTPRTAPWKKAKPAGAKKTTLTPRSIARAKAAAKRAGRRYPNLVDNMMAAREQREAEESRGRAKRPKPSSQRSARNHP